MAPQPEVMVWPLGRVKARDQPLIAEVLVFVIVMLSVRPVFQALTVALTWQGPPGGGGGGGVEPSPMRPMNRSASSPIPEP